MAGSDGVRENVRAGYARIAAGVASRKDIAVRMSHE